MTKEIVKKPVKVFLLVPPVWELSFQSLGIPTLAAWLRKIGYAVETKDLNVQFHRYICKNKKISLPLVKEKYKAVVDSPYYRENYQFHRIDHFIRINLDFGYPHMVCNNFGRLLQFLEDDSVNIYIDYFQESKISEWILSSFPDVIKFVGITVEGENQLVSTLTLAHVLKQKDPNILIALGGPWITQMRKVLKKESFLLKDIDFLVINKGELPIANLLSAIEKQRGIPNLNIEGVMTKRKNGFFSDYFPIQDKLKAEDLPAPELFDISDYLRPNVIPYESIRGCYWGKCNFCHHVPHYTHDYDTKSIKKVISDIKKYKEQFNVKVVAFVDATIPPKRLSLMARSFIREKLDIHWACFCKIERSFNKEIFSIAAQSGLDVISFGVETVSKRLSNFIGKPINRSEAFRVLKDCHDSGIYTTVGILNGLPSETPEDLAELMNFLDDIKNFTYLYPHLFKMERESRFFENSKYFNLEIIPNSFQNHLSVYSEYIDHNPNATTRQALIENQTNKKWWWENMRRYLDWKREGDKFCQSVHQPMSN